MAFFHPAYTSPSLRVGTFESLVVMVWCEGADVADLVPLERMYDGVAARSPRFSAISFVTEMNFTRTPDLSLRDRSTALMRRFEDKMVCNATIIPMRGLGGTVVRSLLTGINLFAQLKTQLKTFNSTVDCWAWVKALPGQNPMVVNEPQMVDHLNAFAATPTHAK